MKSGCVYLQGMGKRQISIRQQGRGIVEGGESAMGEEEPGQDVLEV